MSTDKKMKEPCVAQLYSKKDPIIVPHAPRKTPVMQSSTVTNSDWLEFQKEMRGKVESMNKKLDELKKGQKKARKLLRRVLKLLYNLNDNVDGNPITAYHVSYRHKRNVQNDDSDAMKTDSDDLQFSPQDDSFLDSDIGDIADKDVKAAMDFLNADKVIVCSCWKSKMNRKKMKKREDEDEKGDEEKDDEDDEGENNEEKYKKYEEEGYEREAKENEEKKYENDNLSLFEVNIVLIHMHLDNVKHWVLTKLNLLNWTVEVYDFLTFEGPHNDNVREAFECLSKFIPMLAEMMNLFEFKLRNPPGIYQIPVTIMQDIPRQENG
ncbi:hypothetical protein TIFTF001_024097 [Ficus carica]|uniref:Ubiquitin-like protease family profile domain-containing protein n=1 Tax=Ficus carica TaxID=3494 RepID=A0AA88AXT6_FICCA|nr:hypothetical protein TIFTF001_024097 [Ficus carica]